MIGKRVEWKWKNDRGLPAIDVSGVVEFIGVNQNGRFIALIVIGDGSVRSAEATDLVVVPDGPDAPSWQPDKDLIWGLGAWITENIGGLTDEPVLDQVKGVMESLLASNQEKDAEISALKSRGKKSKSEP